MRLLDRYICREVASHAFLGLAVFTFVFFVPQLVRLMDLIVRHSGGIGTVVVLFLCTLPPVLIFTHSDGRAGRRADRSWPPFRRQRNRGVARLRNQPAPAAAARSVSSPLRSGLDHAGDHVLAQPAALRTLRQPGRCSCFASQAPFAVQPRVFDERFPHFVLYVQDVEAAATHWRGVFLAASAGQAASTITVAEDAQVIHGDNAGQPESNCIWAPAALTNTIRASPSATTSPLLAKANSHRYFCRRRRDRKMRHLQIPKHSVSAASRRARSALARRARRISPAYRFSCCLPGVCASGSADRRASAPRRTRRGLDPYAVLIGGYYFLFVTGEHMAQQGSHFALAGNLGRKYRRAVGGFCFFCRIETIRKPNRYRGLVRSRWSPHRARISGARLMQRRSPSSANRAAEFGSTAEWKRNSSSRNPRQEFAGAATGRTARGFPMMIDVYLLQRFFYYFRGAAGRLCGDFRRLHSFRSARRHFAKITSRSRWC